MFVGNKFHPQTPLDFHFLVPAAALQRDSDMNMTVTMQNFLIKLLNPVLGISCVLDCFGGTWMTLLCRGQILIH